MKLKKRSFNILLSLHLNQAFMFNNINIKAVLQKDVNVKMGRF